VPEFVVGTGGAHQGRAKPDYGFLRLTMDDGFQACFVEVPDVSNEVNTTRSPIARCD
jgi:hypothetical protein